VLLPVYCYHSKSTHQTFLLILSIEILNEVLEIQMFDTAMMLIPFVQKFI
jgi:hypothetical protein